jgi:hypothetical protein
MNFNLDNLIFDLASSLQINSELNPISDEKINNCISEITDHIEAQIKKRKTESTKDQYRAKLYKKLNFEISTFESLPNGFSDNVKESIILIFEEVLSFIEHRDDIIPLSIENSNHLSAQQLAFIFTSLPQFQDLKMSNVQLSKLINILFGNAQGNVRKRLSDPDNIKFNDYTHSIAFMNEWIERIKKRGDELNLK